MQHTGSRLRLGLSYTLAKTTSDVTATLRAQTVNDARVIFRFSPGEKIIGSPPVVYLS